MQPRDLILAHALVVLFLSVFATGQISPERVPNDGLAPQVLTDPQGRLHLVYFKGDPSHGDIFYVRSDDAGKTFTRPLRVNSQPDSALIIGTVRVPHLAISRNGRIHVAWMGSSLAAPKAKSQGVGNTTPMLYSRLNDDGTAFEPQRNLITQHPGLDGGGSIAADADGNVYVAWHAPKDVAGEADRWVWITRSQDDGKTFSAEIRANSDPTGACGCCGLKISTGSAGAVYLAYRTATELLHRDMTLLVSTDHGSTFRSIASDPWRANACVMSTADISDSIAAWETRGQIRFARLDAGSPVFADVPGDGGDRKHPAIAVNQAGDFVIVWAEGTGWNKGGKIAWQMFDTKGKPTDTGQR